MIDQVKELADLLKKADENSSQKFITDYEDAILDNAEYLIANDVVPVVRCKDCKNYEYMSCYNQYFCNRFGGYVTENDYCSRYEGKADNG